MAWGVFEERITGTVHVMPVDRAGQVANGHIPSMGCWCGPVKNANGFIRHNDPEWPGVTEEEERCTAMPQ